jgi:cell shape-determining protein MreC
MALKISDQVKVKFTTLTGEVKGAAIDQTTLAVQYLVEYVDHVGEPQSRYFTEDALELV